MTQALLVGLAVIFCDFVETWFSYPMTTRPLIVGTVIGIVLGDITTGIVVGASLELVFMGVMAIGGTVPPDAVAGTAVGTAYAIILGQGVENGFAVAIPAWMLCQMMFVPFTALRSLWSPAIDKWVEKGDYKTLERIMPLVSLTTFIPRGIVCACAIALGSTAVEGFIAVLPTVLLDGMGVAAGMLGAVGFALLLKMMWTKKLAVYFFVGFILSSYLGLPLMAVAILGILYVIILFVEQNHNGKSASAAADEEEELFND